jgi:hypothetical protein
MKRILFAILFITCSFSAAFSQETINDAYAVKRTVGSFHGIDVATGIKLILTQGETEEVAVSASATEFRDKIITEVVNGVLKIHYETKMGAINKKYENKNLKAYVSYKSINKLNVTTGAEVEIKGTLKSASLKMNANTGGVVKGAIDVDELEVDQNTGSEIHFSGTADKLDVDGDTGSMFKGYELKTSNCDVRVSTGAGIYISVNKELNVRANTGGYVKYRGNAGIRDIKTNTGGAVSRG